MRPMQMESMETLQQVDEQSAVVSARRKRRVAKDSDNEHRPCEQRLRAAEEGLRKATQEIADERAAHEEHTREAEATRQRLTTALERAEQLLTALRTSSEEQLSTAEQAQSIAESELTKVKDELTASVALREQLTVALQQAERHLTTSQSSSDERLLVAQQTQSNAEHGLTKVRDDLAASVALRERLQQRLDCQQGDSAAEQLAKHEAQAREAALDRAKLQDTLKNLAAAHAAIISIYNESVGGNRQLKTELENLKRQCEDTARRS